MVRRGVIGAAWVLVGTCGTLGQSVAFLDPGSYQGVVGAEVRLGLLSQDSLSHPPKARAWPDTIRWFYVRGAGTQENRDTVDTVVPLDEPGYAVWTLQHPGVTLVGVDLQPSVLTVSRDEFAAFVSANTAGAVVPAEPAKVRVLRLESAKTLVRVADGAGLVPEEGNPSTTKSGQNVEIRPLFDPTTLKVGSDLSVRVYVVGDAKEGGHLLATCVATGATQMIPADAKGIAYFHITDPGVWRLQFSHADHLHDDAQADWILSTATLTFEVPVVKERP